MLADILRQLNEIHWLLGYFAATVVTGLLLTIAIFAVSIPAYILSVAAKGPLAAGVAHLNALSLFFWAQTARLAGVANGVINDFVELTKFRLVFDDHEEQFRKIILSIAADAQKFPELINGRAVELEAAINRLADNLDSLLKSEIRASQPQIPDLKQLQVDEAAYRRALWKISFGLFFAPALIVINTFIINEFFKGIVTLYIYDLPLALILSFIFSFAELGLGVAIYIQQQKPRTGDLRRISLEMILILCVIGLASLEAFFYALLSIQMDLEILRGLFAPNPVPQWVRFWLVPFGPTIVILLSFIGHSIVEAWDEMRHGASARALRTQLNAIERAGEKMISDFKVAKGHAKELSNQSQNFRKDFIGAKGQAPTISLEIDQSVGRLREAANEIFNLRREPYSEFSRGDSLRMFYIQFSFNIITAFVIWLFIHIQLTFWPHHLMLPQSPEMILVIAFVEVGIVLGASHFLAQTIRLTIEDKIAHVVSSPTDWIKRLVCIASILGIVGFNFFLILEEHTYSEWLWIALALASIAGMIFMGRNLGLMISALWTWMKGAFIRIAVAGAWVAGALTAILRDTLRFMSQLLSFLAYPFEMILRLLGRSPTLS